MKWFLSISKITPSSQYFPLFNNQYRTQTFYRTAELISSLKYWYQFFRTRFVKDLTLCWEVHFKVCVCYFFSNFYFFTKWQPFKYYEKCFLFHLKALFALEIIKFLWFFPFLSTLPRFKRTNWSGIIYDVMDWLA